MKVFLSWSGLRSKAVAESLRDWLPFVIQAVQPWISASDIDKGTRWGAEVAAQLQEVRVGIVCLTADNLKAPWLLFETGALSKTLEETFVCPYLLDIDPTDLTGPFAQFQATKAQKDDTKELLRTINKALGDDALDEKRLDKQFEKWWPDLDESLRKIPATVEEPQPKRDEREMLEELLLSVRALRLELMRIEEKGTADAYAQARYPTERIGYTIRANEYLSYSLPPVTPVAPPAILPHTRPVTHIPEEWSKRRPPRMKSTATPKHQVGATAPVVEEK